MRVSLYKWTARLVVVVVVVDVVVVVVVVVVSYGEDNSEW